MIGHSFRTYGPRTEPAPSTLCEFCGAPWRDIGWAKIHFCLSNFVRSRGFTAWRKALGRTTE